MIVKQVRLSNKAKDQLVRLKSKTGIQQWNILCRWALCMSLRESSQPPEEEIITDSNVEMTWQVFAGEYQEVFEILIIHRCIQNGLDTDPATLANQFKLHLHRGIAYLATTNFVKSGVDLLKLAVKGEKEVYSKGEEAV